MLRSRPARLIWTLAAVLAVGMLWLVAVRHDRARAIRVDWSPFALTEQDDGWYVFGREVYHRREMAVVSAGSEAEVASGQGLLARVRVLGMSFGTPEHAFSDLLGDPRAGWRAGWTYILRTMRRSPDPEDRRRAAASWDYPAEADRPHLVALLGDRDPRVRAAARLTLDEEFLVPEDWLQDRPCPRLDLLTGATRVEVFRLEPRYDFSDRRKGTWPVAVSARELLCGRPVVSRGPMRGPAFAAELRRALLAARPNVRASILPFDPDVGLRVWKGSESVLVLVCSDSSRFRVVLDEADLTAPRPGGQFLPTRGGTELQQLMCEAFRPNVDVQ